MSNLDLALAAYTDSVLRLSRYGSDNKRIKGPELDPRSDEAMHAEIRKVGKKTAIARLKQLQPPRGSPMAEIVAYGRTVLAEEAGNCFEHAAAACSYLDVQRPQPTFDVVRMPGLDHAFVVIGEPFPARNGNYPADFAAWNADAAICDGWAEIYCLARDYPQQWSNRMDAWNLNEVELPHLTLAQTWTSPTVYRNGVQNEVKESYRWRRSRCCCYITTATCAAIGLPDDCHELQTLRWYRDNVLLSTASGSAAVASYYATAPAIVAAISARPDGAVIYRGIYDRIVLPAVEAIDSGDVRTPYTLFASLLEEMSSLASGVPLLRDSDARLR